MNRALIGPVAPTPTYPTPWRLAERNTKHRIIVCATGHYVAEVPTDDLAEEICMRINASAEEPVS